MPRYALTFIPLLAALLVGYLTYQASLAGKDVPTQEEIDNTPTREELQQQSGGKRNPVDVRKKLKGLSRIMQGEEPDDHATRQSTATKRKRTPGLVEPRENLEAKRYNARLSARKTGVVGGIVAGALGYAVLIGYFVYLSRKNPKQSWQDALAQSQDAEEPTPAPTVTTEAPAEAQEPQPVTPQEDTPQGVADDEIYEPYEPPVDIAEIERQSDQSESQESEKPG